MAVNKYAGHSRTTARAGVVGLRVLGGSQDSLKAIGTVLEAVGAGAITPAEGQAVTSLLEAHRRTFEVEELEHRIEALEAQQCGAR